MTESSFIHLIRAPGRRLKRTLLRPIIRYIFPVKHDTCLQTLRVDEMIQHRVKRTIFGQSNSISFIQFEFTVADFGAAFPVQSPGK